MKALRFTDNTLKMEDLALPTAIGEALVRVVRSGICNTDLEIVRGYAGFSGTIGHEFVGIVEECAENPALVGKRVVGEINVGCGICGLCRAGDSRHCPARTVLGIKGRDGAHAGFLNLPARNLLEVPAGVSDEQAIFTEPLAAAYGITEQVEIGKDTRVAVIGDGKLGILCALSLALESDRVVLIGKHREKLSVARKRSIETDFAESGAKRAGEFDVVVEASGSESGFDLAAELVRPRGKIVLKSTFAGKTSLDLWRVVVDEISVVGSRCGRFAPALQLMAGGRINVEDMISDEFRLEDGVEAMRRAAEKGVLKVMLTM
ncbi:MAG: alcohol dehydrogenase catalytic domain-containing protein [Acidobacteria bacterium]|nr:alcohol dehydrogenase catalytic domain-containing protein [Acidobacteriota bacterium]